MNITKPSCFRPETNGTLYPLCIGMENPQGLALNECHTCQLYVDYKEDNE